MVPSFALATSPTIDGATTAATGADVATNATTTSQEILGTIKDYGLDQVAYMLAQKLGEKMASAAINKATGGASKDKDPNFVRDFGSILTNIEKQQRDLFTTKLLLNANPYARNIAKEMIQAGADPLSNFTLGSVVGAAGDWQAVGNDIALAGKNSLLFYSQLGLPQNNPTGARLLADNALSKQTQRKKETEALKITSSGFLPQAKCNARISDYKNNVQSIIQNEQSNKASGQISDYNSQLISDNASTNSAPTDEASDDPLDKAYESAAASSSAAAAAENKDLQTQATNNSFDTAGNIKGLSEDTAGCIEEMISNPIATTQTLTNEAGKFGMDMTKNIQGWGQIVAGLFVSLFNGFVNKGLSTLKADYGQVKKTNVGGPEQLTSATVNGITNFASVPVNIVDLRTDFEPALVSTQENIEVVKKIKDILLLVPARLAILDILLPGPDFIGFNTRLDKYYDHQTAWLQKNSVVGSDNDRNAYEENILSLLEREYDIARNETTRDMNDDTRNIPGAGTIRSTINSFTIKKQKMQAASENLETSTNALTELRQINVAIKKNIDWLKTNNPADFGSLPTIVFTKEEWTNLTTGQKDASFQWAKSFVVDSVASDTDPYDTDDEKRDLVIQKSWDLWESPSDFVTGTGWTAELNTVFLDEKNNVRAKFSSIRDVIPSDWEISKNQQEYSSYVSEITRIDNLIYDTDKMRELIWGNTATENGWLTQNPGTSPRDLLNYMIDNRDTLFKSDDIKNALTLPNVLNSSISWEADGCRPGALHAQDQAQFPSAANGADHSNGYSCYGNFGYTKSGIKYGPHQFDVWIDDDSNQYQSQPHIGWPSELYWKARIVKAVPPPDPDTYKKGWTIEVINNGVRKMDDGGMSRGIFCRLSSVSAVYGRFSGYALDHNAKNMYCSSLWTDVTVADSIGLFLVNQLR